MAVKDKDLLAMGEADLASLSDEERERLATKHREGWLTVARKNFNVFTSYVMRDEYTGKSLRQGHIHREWNRLRIENRNVIIIGFVGSGKSTQFTQGLPLFRLGRNNRQRIILGSAVEKNAAHTVRVSKNFISDNPELQECFPDLKRGDKWLDHSFNVNRPGYIRHPSLQATGIGSRIQGNRVDGFIGDDILDDDNTRTAAARDGAYRWFTKNILSRTHPTRSWKVLIGNAWHPDDLYNRLSRDGWPKFIFPATATQRFIDQGLPHPKPGQKWVLDEPLWPEYWPEEAVQAKREELKNPIEFARQMMCEERDDSIAKFKEAWIELALDYGRGLTLVSNAGQVMDEEDPPIFFTIGFDPASGREHGDLSALVVLATYANGDRRPLEVSAGHWDIYEQAANINSAAKRYVHPVSGPPLVGVENNGVQEWLVKILKTETATNVVALHTGKNKADPRYGIEVMAHEMANDKWIIPNEDIPTLYDSSGDRIHKLDPDIGALVHDMQYYVPDVRVHTGDRLMATWFAWRLATQLEARNGVEDDREDVGIRIIGGRG